MSYIHMFNRTTEPRVCPGEEELLDVHVMAVGGDTQLRLRLGNRSTMDTSAESPAVSQGEGCRLRGCEFSR